MLPVKETGKGLALLGALGFLAAYFLMPTSVPSGPYGTDSMVNLALQQRQTLVALGCLALFLAGVVLVAAGSVSEAVAGKTSSHDAAIEDEATAMERYGITREASGYVFGSFAYPKLAQAVAQARKTKG
jgi:hypothetical protein